MPIPVCNGDKVCGGIVIGGNLNDLDNLQTEPITLSPVPAPYYSETSGGGGGDIGDADTLEGEVGAFYLSRSNHTGTQTASTISDFDTEVSNNSSVAANTAKISFSWDYNYNDLINTPTIPTNNNQLTNGAGYITGNETITISGDANGSGTTSIDLMVDKITRTVRNETGGTLTTGTAVYISGFNNYPLVSKADNTIDTREILVGIVESNISDESNGTVVTVGQMDLDTDSLGNVGDEIYLSTNGSLTTTKPTSGDVIVIGKILVKDNSGSILIYKEKHSEDIAVTANTDINVRMGDSAGSNKVSFKDYANNEVASLDSDGNFTSNNISGSNTGDQDLSGYQPILSEGAFVDGDKTKLNGIETSAEVNNISDANATDLTDGGNTTLHVHTESMGIAISAYGVDIEAATGVAYFDIPYAFTLTEVYGTIGVAPVGSSVIIDINEAGTSILTNLITIEDGETSSKDATTQPSLSDTSLASGARITFDIDQIGAGTAGQEVIIFLIGYRS